MRYCYPNPSRHKHTTQLTPYDSPAMWKGFPVNLLKCSKNMATNAAMSTAASSVVLLVIGQLRLVSEVTVVLTTSSPCSAYEKPTPTGCSTKNMFALSFQPYGLNSVFVEFTVLHGPGIWMSLKSDKRTYRLQDDAPSSMSNPSEDDPPGPPFVQKITSSSSGLLRLSKK